MTNNSANLRVRVSADLADIKQGLGLLRGELAAVKRQAAEALPDTKAFEAGIGRAKKLIAGLFAGVSAGMLVKTIVGETGQAQAELAQLRAALKSTREAAGLTESGLVSMAEKMTLATTHSTGELIEAQTRLLSYSGIAKNEFPRALQLAIDQSVRLTESVTQSAETVGKALESPAQGVTALTKAGFRFTAEQKKMLKQLEETGKLAEAQAIVMEVMEESYAGAAAAARNTLPGALKALGDAMRQLLDGNGGSGAIQLTKAVNDLIAVVSSPQAREAFASLADSILKSAAAFAKWMASDGVGYLNRLAQAVAFVARNLDVLLVLLISIGIGRGIVALRAATAGMTLLGGATNLATAAAARLRAALATVGGPVTLVVAALTAAIYALYKRSTQARDAAIAHKDALDQVRETSKHSTQDALRLAEAMRTEAIRTLEAAEAQVALAKARLAAAQEGQSRASGRYAQMKGGVTAAAGTALLDAQNAEAQAKSQLGDIQREIVELAMKVNDELLETARDTEDGVTDTNKKIAASNALLRDSIARTLAELDRLYADNEIGVTEYFQKRQKLQEQAIDAEIQQARMQLAVAEKGEQRLKIEEDIVKLQRDRAEIAPAIAREEKKAIEELDKILAKAYVDRLENEGKLAAAVRARLEEENRESIVRLQNQGRHDDVKVIRLNIETEVAKAQLSQFEEEMTATLARLQGTEQTLAAQQQAGLLGVLESEQQIKDARTGALEQLVDIRQRALEFLATLDPDSPEAAKVLQFLGRLDGDIAVVASSMDRFRQQIADAAINSVTSLFMDLVEGSKSAGEALRDFVRGFALAMAQIAARALATILVLKMMDALWPGSGKMLAASFGVTQYHSGGIAGAAGGVRRWVPPAIFNGAPQYHTGGIAGLAPNEVPAILERGEEVLTRSDARHRDNLGGGSGGGGGGRVTTPVVVFGDQELANALAGSAGEQMVITHVRNNRRAIDD